MVMLSTGIAAAVSRGGAVASEALARMLGRMGHRGPDATTVIARPAEGAHAELGCVGMACVPDGPPDRRIPDDAGHGAVLVIDGHVRNVDAITRRLGAAGIDASGLDPTQAVSLALSRWGESVIDTLEGHFALIHYDPHRRRLLLARDPLGVKPLFWAMCREGDGVVAASEIQALLASGHVSMDYDQAGIASYLAYGTSHAPQTILRHVHAVPAGCWLEIALAAGRIEPGTPVPYWTLPQRTASPDPAADVERLRTALDAAVEGLTRGLPTASTFLPGDVTSAVLAVLANRHLPEMGTAFIDVESEGCDERARLAAAIAGELGSRHVQMIVDEEWGGSLWLDWLQAADGPCVDGYDAYVTSQAIRDTGSAVAVVPAAGSELLRATPMFAMIGGLLEIAHRVGNAPRWLRSSLRSRILDACSPSSRELVHDACTADATPMSIALQTQRVFRTRDLERLGLLAGDATDGTCLPATVRSAVAEQSDDLFADIVRLHCRVILPNRTMRACDSGGMANSLDLRMPFADRRVVESLAGMPGTLISPKPSRSGAIIQQIAAGMLPYNLLVRQEPGPRLSFARWMTVSLRGFSERCIDAVAACAVLDGDAVQAAWRGISTHSCREDLRKGLALVTLGSFITRLGSRRVE